MNFSINLKKSKAMKTLTLIIIAAMSVSLVFSQTPLKLVKERVGNPEILKNWNVGVAKHVNGSSILRLDGENGYESITNVFYTSNNRINSLVDEKADAEAMTSEKAHIVPSDEKSVSGGQIALFYCRPDELLAAPARFNVQVMDENGSLLWSYCLDKEQPHYYKWGIWYFYETINVPVDAGQKFIVQVNDAAGGQSFTFKVFINEPGKEKQPDLSLR